MSAGSRVAFSLDATPHEIQATGDDGYVLVDGELMTVHEPAVDQ